MRKKDEPRRDSRLGCPAEQSEAISAATVSRKHQHLTQFADKPGFCSETGPTGILVPRGRATTIAEKPTARRRASQWRRQTQPDFLEHYTLALVASPADAGTARVRAHSRCAAISSARVVESGTVCASASSRDCVLSALFSE